jgi:hypothetical protein
VPSCRSMQRTAHQQTRDPSTHPNLLRAGGIGAVLAGVLFVAWGYLDQENAPPYFYALVHVLASIVPALFAVGLVALYALGARQMAWPGKLGMLLGLLASVVGTARGLVYAATTSWYAHDVLRGYPTLLNLWMPTLFAGLLVAGVGAVGKRALGRWDTLMLVMGTCGWGYYFTDSGAVFEARSVHVSFGLLFSRGWVVLGLALWTTSENTSSETV